MSHSPGKTVTTQHIIYAAPDGHDLRLSLFLPPEDSAAPRPCIILIHGGAWISGTHHQMRWYGRHFAEAGYVAIAISYRKLPFFCFPHCVHDAKSAVRWARRHAVQYNIDPERIAALGNSAGGHLAMMLGATRGRHEFEGSEHPGFDSHVQAVISVYGAVNLNAYKEPTGWSKIGGIGKHLVAHFMHEFGIGDEIFDIGSPANYLSPETAPTLFVHGTHDNLVPYGVAKECHEKLLALGVPAKLITVRGVGHGFDYIFPPKRRMVFKEMLAFLDEHLRLNQQTENDARAVV